MNIPRKISGRGYRLNGGFFAICSLLSAICSVPVHAISITAGPTLVPPTTLNSETNPSLTNGVTVQFTTDVGGQATVAIFDSNLNQVASVTQAIPGGATSIFWSALWPIGADLGRHDGNFFYQVTPIAGGTAGTPAPALGSAGSQFTINSVDIHNLTASPSVDASGQATYPIRIGYALAKGAKVTVTILNSSGTIISTPLSAQPQADETISTPTVTWSGIQNSGIIAPIGGYTVQVNATDLINGDPAIVRTRNFTVTSLAGGSFDAQKAFESGVFVFPNPVRNGQATFQMGAVRDGANLKLRIYTISGTLVFEQAFPGIPAGTSTTFNWNAANQAGNKVGRGLYYYVVREDDATGTLQTVKKLAVIP